MQSTAMPTSMDTSLHTIPATPTTTVQSVKPNKLKAIYVVGSVGGGMVAILTLTIIVVIVVYYWKRKTPVDYRPLLRFDDDSDEENDTNDDGSNI